MRRSSVCAERRRWNQSCCPSLTPVSVAPFGLRVGTTLASLAPELASSVQRRLNADDLASQMEVGQRDRRA